MLKFDNETRRVVRDGVPSEVNPFDLQAITACAAIKDSMPAEIVAVTMGPPQAREALVQCMALGADRGIHLNDRAFAGSDTLATARALSLALAREKFDLILCGINSVDAETGQVGPEIAEMLNLPQVTGVSKIQVSEAGDSVTVTRLNDEGHQEILCPLPALLTAAEGIAPEIYPSPEQMEEAESKPIEELSAADISPDTDVLGVSGSPTSVGEVYSTESRRDGIIIRDLPTDEAVAQLMANLESRGVFGDRRADEVPSAPRGPRQPDGANGGTWVVAETLGGRIRPVTFELLGEARELSRNVGSRVEAVLIGDGVEEQAGDLTAYGADCVYVADSASLRQYDTELYTGVLAQAIEAHKPYAVLIPSTINGRDLAARLAARLKLGLTGDCIGLETDSEGRLVQLKPAFGGAIVAPILSNTFPQMATVRPGILAACQPDWSIEPVTRKLPVDDLDEPRVKVLESVQDHSLVGGELEHARRVIGVGKGIGAPDNLSVIQPLVAALGASIGATREVTDAGWLPRQVQIGLSGKAIAPELYIAVAVRGPFNHTVGIQRSGTIVAINNSARSPIFRAADFGILGDYADVVPVLTKAIEQRLTDSGK
ncbi:MAG: electron transfer flavoprotein alpha/ beta subunit [Chloroflexi bacterium]|nr:electron transfer flavoprotein alpha/ beta subunit [Chloroflexota bacterium]